MLTVLHVEHDDLLAEAVKDAFAAFGFRGTYQVAHSVRETGALLAQPTGPTVDLILSDMELPDGTGLDVVRNVRANPSTASVPIVILSADTDPKEVDQAYVLGANACLHKGERGRSIGDTISALYAHWLRDVHLPSTSVTTRAQQYLARGSSILSRRAAIYIQIAEQLGRDDGTFWMDLALRDGNLANLCAFLSGQLEGRELPDGILDELDAVQRSMLRAVEDIEKRPVRTSADAQRHVLAMVSSTGITIVDRALGLLFPNPTIATTTLRTIIGATLDDIASWIESRATDAALRNYAPRLRTEAALIRS
jgi:CheY-like chemotaxis protein